MTTILPPTNCPSCDSVLEWVNNVIYCRNYNCSARIEKKVEHFAKTLKIKGLGPATIAKLGLSELFEIYDMDETQIADALSSEKLGSKLFMEIENSRNAPLDLVLPAFGVPLIGNTATKKLSTIIYCLFELNIETCKAAGLGPKATESLMNWYGTFDSAPYPFDFCFSSNQPVYEYEFGNKGIVCISGKLKSFKTKAEATEALNHAGYEVKSSLTKQVTILLNESEIESSKTKQARDSGIQISTNINELLEI